MPVTVKPLAVRPVAVVPATPLTPDPFSTWTSTLAGLTVGSAVACFAFPVLFPLALAGSSRSASTARNIRADCGCSHDSSAAGSPGYGTTGTVTS